MQAIVYPIITGKNWCVPAPPLPLDRASKAAAIRALHAWGYRIRWVGGTFDVQSTTDLKLRTSRTGIAAVAERERELGYLLPDGAEIVKYIVSVYPQKP